ncbi:ParA family protein [Actinomadura kijaniata]|uniref:ParA family protein n=1 Tax=Actinomadura kijaniata TaxID=46161 RepID=UPI001471483E|nr:ParA family protein [Actinomadura kijaniata]
MLVCAQYSEKGGVGKTSTTNGLAAVAAERGMRVVVVDADPRGSATAELGITDTSQIPTLNDLLAIPDHGDPIDPAEAVHDALQPAGPDWPSTVRVIAAERPLAHRETDPNPIEGRLARALRALDGEVDLVLCDTPPRPAGKLVAAVLTAADTVLIPSSLTTDGYEGVVHARRSLRLSRQGANPDLRYSGIVRTIVPREHDRRAIHDRIEADLFEQWPDEVLDVQLTEYAVREEARYACVPLTLAGGQYAKLLLTAYGQLLDHVLSGEDFGL